jgi:hypothetical protein
MLTAARRNPSRRQVSRTISVPAPVAGWNRRDSVAAMKPLDAIQLDNYFPTASDIVLRKGEAEHATDIVDAGQDEIRVETIAVYRPQSGPQQMWAFADEYLFDVTGTGAVGTAELSSLTNARWQNVNFASAGGHFLLAVNGADDLLRYDGTDWLALNTLSTPSITGVASSSFANITVFKERPYYVEGGSMSVWYPAVGTFAGALTEFSLDAVFKRGGYMMAMGSWTVDGGLGLDDFAVFVSSEGEVAVYKGTDPGDTAWSMVGLYNIGSPIGRDCLRKYGGDLLIITNDGVVPASKAFINDRTSKAIAITDKIQGAMSDSAASYKTNAGWSITQFPAGSMLILNVPVAPDREEQYVMNSVTGAWCRFTGWAASCFEIFNDELYFGTLGGVRKAWTGTSDVGAQIVGEIVPAFSYFGSRTQLKQWVMFRPIVAVDVNPEQIRAGIDVDYIITTPQSAIDFPAIGGSLWDVAQWDLAVWGGLPTVQSRWYSATAVGYCAAAHFKTSSSRSVIRLLAIDYVVCDGGVV